MIVLAERLAVAQVGRAREHVDLRAGIVDVVFARDLVAGEVEQVGERIAEHRAAAMADMHRAGRVGRDVFDIDRLAAGGAAAVTRRRPRSRCAARRPRPRGLQRQVDEARPGDLDLLDQVVGAQLGGDQRRRARAASSARPWPAPSRRWSPCRRAWRRAAARPATRDSVEPRAARPMRSARWWPRCTRLEHGRENVRVAGHVGFSGVVAARYRKNRASQVKLSETAARARRARSGRSCRR